tara:strand:- start:726 stop:860 length:135 start_codon:yes stop_codon:yes gene_type:complete
MTHIVRHQKPIKKKRKKEYKSPIVWLHSVLVHKEKKSETEEKKK